MTLSCASNAAINNIKIASRNFPKSIYFQKKYHVFSDFGGSSRHFDHFFTGLGLIAKL